MQSVTRSKKSVCDIANNVKTKQKIQRHLICISLRCKIGIASKGYCKGLLKS